MGFMRLDYKNSMVVFIITMMLLRLVSSSSSSSSSIQDYICSRATYYGSPDCQGNPSGACGYGEYGRSVNDGYVAGVHRPYRNGTGCGACYQVRCTSTTPGECREEGVIVVATDFGVGDWTDFLFPARAYARMASLGYEAKLLSYGVVNIEYKRVPCTFSFRGTGSNNNLIYSVHQHTNYPHYLAVIILYPPGLYDVVGAQIWEEDCKAWRNMRKPYGALWDFQNPPPGDVRIRFLISASPGNVNVDHGYAKWVESTSLIPAYWEAGVTYQLAISI